MQKLTLKALRVNAGLTQEETAKRLGVSPTTLSRWEQGKSYPDIKTVSKIEKLFGVSYNDIIFLI